MRFLSALFLIALVGGLGYLAYINNHSTEISAGAWHQSLPLPALIAGVYALGMVSGWWLIGLTKRSWQRVTEPDRATA